MKRNPTLTIRTPELLTKASATVTSEDIDKQFKILTDYIERNGLQELYDRPDAWYNADESGVDLNAHPSKIVTSKRIRHTFIVEKAGHHQRITITLCVCADGSILPPQVIFKKGFTRLEEAAYACGGK